MFCTALCSVKPQVFFLISTFTLSQFTNESSLPPKLFLCDKTQTRSTKYLLGASLTKESYSNLVPFPTDPRVLSQVSSPSLACTVCRVGLGTEKLSKLSQVTSEASHKCDRTTMTIWAIPQPLGTSTTTAISAPLSLSIPLAILRPNLPWKSVPCT